MKKIFSNKSRLVMIAAVCIAVIIGVTGVILAGRAGVFTNIINTVTTPVKTLVTGVAVKVEELYDYMYGFDELKAENELLKKQIAEMESEVRDATALTEENTRLRTLLGLKEDHDDYEMEIASVVSYDSSNWNSTFTISKGSNSGIEANMCVITEAGYVVGIVTETGLNWSTVTAITDVDTEIGAVAFRSGDIGVAEGDFQLMEEGLLRLSYLPTDAELLNGDDVLTSGGELYPQGLVLGTIKDVLPEASGVNKYAVIEPAAKVENLTQVFVVTYFEQ